jgi:2,4-dienoyl-CoA reductase-like NADH-dependent reductase (Old Yellow Enzyme family)
MPASHPLLFTPIRLREVAPRNRAMLSPMCTYSARDGLASDWPYQYGWWLDKREGTLRRLRGG